MKGRPLRILIIDDHSGYLDLLRDHIIKEWPNAEVDVISPPEKSADLLDLDARQYHVVLLQHKPGTHSGIELLRELRNNPRFPPIVFMTAQGDERLAAAAIKSGAADYLPKIGLDGSLLVTTIRECLRASMKTLPKRNRFSTTGQGESVVGVSVKGYDILKKFSSGTGSVIYLAHSESRNEEVVLKVLYGNYELSEESEVLERFLIEFQSVASVSHPNIVNIHDVGVADDHVFIVMEYIRGGSLRERLARQGALPLAESFDIALHITDALTAIHQVGILHRDLKPGNVMFRDENGPPCIIDFGLAKQVQIEQEITLPGKIYGTPYYMSPEQGQGLEIDERSDFYSLGVLLFEMLTGRKPYVAGTPIALLFKHTHAPIPQLDESLQDYQPLIDHLLAKDPAGRPTTAEQLIVVLNEYKRL